MPTTSDESPGAVGSAVCLAFRAFMVVDGETFGEAYGWLVFMVGSLWLMWFMVGSCLLFDDN